MAQSLENVFFPKFRRFGGKELRRGAIVNRTYGIHKNVYLVCLTIFTDNIWSC